MNKLFKVITKQTSFGTTFYNVYVLQASSGDEAIAAWKASQWYRKEETPVESVELVMVDGITFVSSKTTP